MVRAYYLIRVFEYILKVLRFFAPWVARTFMFILGIIATGVVTFWSQVPTRIDQIANEWLDRAVDAGFPTEWDRRLYYVLWCLAFATIVLGWILVSYLTVWVVRIIF